MMIFWKDFNFETSELSAYVISWGNTKNEHYFAEIPMSTRVFMLPTPEGAYYAPTSSDNILFKDEIKDVKAEKIKMYWSQTADLRTSENFNIK